MRKSFVAMSLCAVALSTLGAASEASTKSNKELLGAATGLAKDTNSNAMKDGKALIDAWLKASQALNSYTFSYQMTCFKPGGTVTSTGNMYFKKPRLMKFEQTGGPDKGSVAILQADGKVKGHKGGALKFFNATLSPDSSMLNSANGWPMVKSDFTSLAEAVEGYIKEGDAPKMSESPVTVPGHSEKLNIFELYKGGPNGALYKKALFLPDSNLPIEWWDYRNGKLWAHSTWSNFKAVNLSDEVFTMKGDK